MPDIPLVPTGGMDVNWALIGDALAGGSVADLRTRAERFVEAVRL